MWPLLLILGAGAAALLSKKSSAAQASSPATGPSLLAAMTIQYGALNGLANWTAPSGRTYRVAHWLSNTLSGTQTVVLAIGGAGAAQPSEPDMAYAYLWNSGDPYHFTGLVSNLADPPGITDMAQLRVNGGLSSIATQL